MLLRNSPIVLVVENINPTLRKRCERADKQAWVAMDHQREEAIVYLTRDHRRMRTRRFCLIILLHTHHLTDILDSYAAVFRQKITVTKTYVMLL